MRRIQTLALIAPLVLLLTGTAWANPADTTVTTSFNPASPVPEGTIVDVIGTVVCTVAHDNGFCDAAGKPVTVGSLRIQRFEDAGMPVACDDPDGSYEAYAMDPDEPDANGSFAAAFDTTGFGGQTIGWRTHYVTGGVNPSKPATGHSDCEDLEITLDEDPLPDGAFSYTQGHYGASPQGEAIVALLIDEAICEDILDALTGVPGVPSSPDCSDAGYRGDLADFLVGEVGNVGGNNDGGFLPSGFNQYNLAAQTITLLLNLNLAAVLTGDDIPILESYFINIDPVTDLVGGVAGATYDPVATTGGKLGSCTVSGTECTDVPVLSDLGMKVEALDMVAGGTTVGDILAAALVLLLTDTDPQTINGESCTEGDLKSIVGLINEAFDEDDSTGVDITGFVTGFDAD